MSDNLSGNDLTNLIGFDSTTSSAFDNYIPDGVPDEYARDAKTLDFSNWYASGKEDQLLRIIMEKPILGKGVEAIASVQNEIATALNLINNDVPTLKNNIASGFVDNILFNKTLWAVFILVVIIWIMWRYYQQS